MFFASIRKPRAVQPEKYSEVLALWWGEVLVFRCSDWSLAFRWIPDILRIQDSGCRSRSPLHPTCKHSQLFSHSFTPTGYLEKPINQGRSRCELTTVPPCHPTHQSSAGFNLGDKLLRDGIHYSIRFSLENIQECFIKLVDINTLAHTHYRLLAHRRADVPMRTSPSR